MTARDISGAGDGKSGGGEARTPVVANDTLQSRALARAIDVLGEGEIAGLVNGAQSIFLDDVPLQNQDGSFNFEGVQWGERRGLPDQSPLEGFEGIEREVPVGITVTADGGPVVQVVDDPAATAARLTLATPVLQRQNLQTGDITAAEVSFRIEVAPAGGAYMEMLPDSAFKRTSGNPTPGNTRGLRATITKVFPEQDGVSNSFYSAYDIGFEYRAQGAQTWTSLIARQGTIYRKRRTRLIGSGRRGELEQQRYVRREEVSFSAEVILPEQAYEWRVTGGAQVTLWARLPTPLKIAGKTSSRYERGYRVPLPAGGVPWSLRVTRLTPDSQSQTLRNELQLARKTEIIDRPMIYPDSALIGLALNAEQFGGTPPRRAYEVKGLLVDVPSNYDPETREYTGIWDGTFKRAWTNNPAWCFRDLLINGRYGLGLDPGQVDKWSLYEIAQHCDGLVDDGFGGLEPRFTFNGVFNSRVEAYRAVTVMAAAFRGMTYWASGTVIAKQDVPQDPVKLVTPANVIDGRFNYQGTRLKSRHSVVLVSYTDPEIGDRLAIETVEDPELLERFGYRPLELAGFGTNSRGQARRLGLWVLETEKAEANLVTYRAGWDHADVTPGDVVEIADPKKAGVRWGGRLAAIEGDTVTLDAPVTLNIGSGYSLTVVQDDGGSETLAVLQVVGGGDSGDRLQLAAAPANTAPGRIWVLRSDALVPRPYRVLAVVELEPGLFEVTALAHDATKFARIEEGLELEQPDSSVLPRGRLAPPSNLTVAESLVKLDPNLFTRLLLSWEPSSDPRVIRYLVKQRLPDESGYRAVGQVAEPLIVLEDQPVGQHGFEVMALDGQGRVSVAARLDPHTVLGLSAPPADVTGFEAARQGQQLGLKWATVTDLDLSHYELRLSPKTDGTATWASAVPLVERIPGNATSVTVAAQAGTYLIKAVDLGGTKSVNATAVISTTAVVGNVVLTLDEHPGFAGSKSGVLLDPGAGGLVLSGSTQAGQSGSYDFVDRFDNGAVAVLGVSGAIEAAGLAQQDNLFFIDDIFAVEDLLSTTAAEGWDVQLELRSTDDDPAGSPTWSDWRPLIAGSLQARALEFRARLSTSVAGITPVVSALSVTVDMPDRIESAVDLLADGGGGGQAVIVFSPAFKAPPEIQITAQDMLSGDYFTITAKSASGFTITFYNASGTQVARTFDWSARGYGNA